MVAHTIYIKCSKKFTKLYQYIENNSVELKQSIGTDQWWARVAHQKATSAQPAYYNAPVMY